MTEKVGTLLWEMRNAGGWTLGRLAQQAGVSKSALSRWEAGERQPRVTELEAVLDALNADTAQRTLAFARIQAPRALRYLRATATGPDQGAMPVAGDLLRAMRLRKRWTQNQVATAVRVRQNTVARWERGERLPDIEQIQAICYALGAHEEEIVALTTGRFREAPSEPTTDWKEQVDLVSEQTLTLIHQADGPQELRFLALEREAWILATRHPECRTLLALVLTYSAEWHRYHEHWAEVSAKSQRALSLIQAQSSLPEFAPRTVLMHAVAAVHGSHRPAPERGQRELHAYLLHSHVPEYTGWMLADMAKYAALDGQVEWAVQLADRAIQVTEGGYDADVLFRQIDYARILTQAGQPGYALEHLPKISKDAHFAFLQAMLVLVEACLAVGDLTGGYEWLCRALDALADRSAPFLKHWANTLAQNF